MAVLRSWMFVPGNQQRKLDKAAQLRADVIVYDLEDAVPAVEKEHARQAVSAAMRQQDVRLSYVRVNDTEGPWWSGDLEAVVQASLKGIMLPKASNAAQIALVDERLSQLERKAGISEGTVDLVPLIESAEGVFRAYELAGCCRRVRRLAFGSLDYTLDVNGRWTEDGAELLYPRSQLVVHSRAAGIEAPVDAAYIRMHDEAGLRKDTNLSRQLGFQGRLVIHPAQLDPVNETFSPTAEEIDEARQVIEAYRLAAAEGVAAIQWNGKMVDLPVVRRCSKLLEAASELGLASLDQDEGDEGEWTIQARA